MCQTLCPGLRFIIFSYPHSNPIKEVLFFFTYIFQKRNGSTERLSSFPEGTQQNQVSLALTLEFSNISYGIHESKTC